MYKEGTESWRLVTSGDMSLNFAIFTGCIYGLVDESTELRANKLWPTNCWLDKSNEVAPLLKEQWSDWFNSMIKDRGEKIIQEQNVHLNNFMFSPPNFDKFPYDELRRFCKNAWQPFIEWWEMVGGGRNGLSYFEILGNEKIYEYISEFENMVGRKVKPFNLYIDFIYTNNRKIIEVNSEYIVMIPDSHFYFDKDWWMNKLKQIG